MKLTLILLPLVLLINSCKTEEVEVIPDISFSSTIYLGNPEYNSNPFIVKKDDLQQYYLGHRGVVVYRHSPSEYYAFDLMCTYDKSVSCLIEISDGINAQCPCCESEFLIMTEFGDVLSEPASWSLKKYKTRLNGDYLTIYN